MSNAISLAAGAMLAAAVTVVGGARQGVQVAGTGDRDAAGARPAAAAAGQNLPPLITDVAIQSVRENAPPNFADVGDDVAVSASVTDQETPLSRLTFEWSADLGVFSGTGPAVRWRAPEAAVTPRAVRITLRVSEVAHVLDGRGGMTAVTQTSTKTVPVSLHDSAREIGEMSRQFLLDFSDSTLPPNYVVRDFWDGCPGKALELNDVIANRRDYAIRTYTVGTPTLVAVNFGGACAYGSENGDGCSAVPWEWHDTHLPTGRQGTTVGTEYLSTVYRDSRWWLCSSGFKAARQ